MRDGIHALKNAHRQLLDENIRAAFADSLDIDQALLKDHEKEPRWDYLLGHDQSGALVGIEPHSVKEAEIRAVIMKKESAAEQLRNHLKRGKLVARWLWVASGKVYFADTEKARRQLDQHGIQFVGKKVLSKHLDGL